MIAPLIVATQAQTWRSWREHAVALGLLILLVLVGFRDAVAAAVQVWWLMPTYSHCFLVIPISAWLVWEKRDQLASLNPAVEPRALWALPPLLFVWWLGETSTINEVRQFAVVGLVQVAIIAMLGLGIYRAILFPALYLFFLVPTGEYLIGPMQRFATQFADLTLNLIGLPHHTEGTIIELTNGRFEIAEACAGLRFLIATVALGVLFAHMMFRKWYKVFLFLLSCVAVPLAGNGLRVVGIILLAHFTNNEYGTGVDHIVYGWGFNVAILLVLFLFGSLFRDNFEENNSWTSLTGTPDTMKTKVIVFATFALLIGIGPAAAFWHDGRVIEPDIAALNRPMHLRDWHMEPPMGIWHPAYPGVDTKLEASLIPDSPDAWTPVELFVGYFGRPRAGHALTAHVNKLWDEGGWIVQSSGDAEARLGSNTTGFQEWIVSSAAERRLIWASYWVDGAFTTSLFKVKLLQAQAALEGHEGQALVVVSTIIDTTDDGARARLLSAVSALGDLPDRLDSANRRIPVSRPSK